MKLTIDLNNPQDVADALALLQGSGATAASPAATTSAVAPAASPAPVAAPAPAPAAPPATPQAAPVAAPAPAAAPVPAAAVAPVQGGEVSQADFAAAVQNYAKANSPKATKAVFASLGYTKISDVPPDQYAAVMPHFQVEG